MIQMDMKDAFYLVMLLLQIPCKFPISSVNQSFTIILCWMEKVSADTFNACHILSYAVKNNKYAPSLHL